MKSAVCVTLVLFFNYSATALKCYSCNIDTYGVACHDPLGSNVKALDCRVTASLRLTSNDTQIPISSNNNSHHDIQPRDLQNEKYSEYDSYSNDFQCVQFEIRNNYYGNKDYVRKCIRRSSQENYCSSLERSGRYKGYSVTKCDVCYSDYCNSSKNIKLSLFLNAIFFVIFYYTTDSGKK